jgi:hypothetical protein
VNFYYSTNNDTIDNKNEALTQGKKPKALIQAKKPKCLKNKAFKS